MDNQEILASLDRHRGSFPQNLVEEVIARREEMTPRFLEILEDVDKDPEPWLADDSRMIHIYAMYCLALFREARAYPLLVSIFSRPGEFPFDLTGDVVTQDLSRILASVSGGDVVGMATLIENECVNEWVRGAAMGGMVELVAVGQRTRDEVMAYFLRLFNKLERKPGGQWDCLANLCADLGPQEATEELRRAYADRLVDPQVIAWEDIEEALALGPQGAMRRSRYREPLINDLARDMGWMECFEKKTESHEEEPESNESLLKPLWRENRRSAPIRRTTPKVGRNEPCPCGSGRKYKKCCAAV